MRKLQEHEDNHQPVAIVVPAQHRDVPIASLVLASQVYPRCNVDYRRVEDLVEALEAGAQPPPITVQRGTGVVLNGWHWVKAYGHLGHTHIPVEEVEVADELLALPASRTTRPRCPTRARTGRTWHAALMRWARTSPRWRGTSTVRGKPSNAAGRQGRPRAAREGRGVIARRRGWA
jgi:hypothetical protein